MVGSSSARERGRTCIPQRPPESAWAACCQQVADVLLRELVRLNSEYASYCPPERQRPLVRLHRHGDPDWFPVGVKHSWTR